MKGSQILNWTIAKERKQNLKSREYKNEICMHELTILKHKLFCYPFMLKIIPEF